MKNKTLTPMMITPGSSQEVWWRCRMDSSHEWQSVIYNRVKGNGCPYCAGKKVTSTTSLLAQYAALASEWHSEKNAPLTAQDVLPGSNKKVWWRCRIDPAHEWPAVIAKRVEGAAAQCAAGELLPLRPRYKPFVQSLLKNGHLTPAQVTAWSHQKVWWLC